MQLSRRSLLAGAGALGVSGLAAGCGFVPSTSSGVSTDAVTFTTWGTDAELAEFRSLIAGFEKANPGAEVMLNSVPYEQMFTNVDAQLQAGNPPDVFRVPYYTFGSYAGRGQLLDLSGRLPTGFRDRFTPQAWAAVQADAGSRSRPFGVPHHTDTTVILYNADLLRRAGVTSVPTRLAEAWTWEQFRDVADKLRRSLPESRYPFAYNWQGNGVTRWLTWLFEAGGRFLSEDGRSAQIDSAAGATALDYTRAFFPDRLVPANSSVKSTVLAADLWYAQTTAMNFGGAFLVPDADTTAQFEWGATYAPRLERSSSDFGGNALVVTQQTSKAEQAVAFLDYVTRRQQMRDFCAGASLLPTRTDLVGDDTDFAFETRPGLTRTFLDQASTVRATDSAQVASPSMSAIITVLTEQLEQAFVGDLSTGKALAAMSAGIKEAVA